MASVTYETFKQHVVALPEVEESLYGTPALKVRGVEQVVESRPYAMNMIE